MSLDATVRVLLPQEALRTSDCSHLLAQFGSDSLAQDRIAVHESFPVRFVELSGGVAHTILEFQWIKICCIVKEIDVFTSLEP